MNWSTVVALVIDVTDKKEDVGHTPEIKKPLSGFRPHVSLYRKDFFDISSSPSSP